MRIVGGWALRSGHGSLGLLCIYESSLCDVRRPRTTVLWASPGQTSPNMVRVADLSGFGFVCYLTLLLHWLSLYSTAVVESGGHHALDCLMRHNLCIVALWDPEAMLPWACYLLSKLISKPPFYFNIPRVSPVLYIITDALHPRSFSFLFLLSLLN